MFNQPPRTVDIEEQKRIPYRRANRAPATPAGSVSKHSAASDQASGDALAGCRGTGAGTRSASGCSAFAAGLYGTEEAARRSFGSAKEGSRAGFRRTDLCASGDGDGRGVCDRVRVLGWKQDAHSVEEFLCAGLGKLASRLAGSGAMIHITAQMRVLVAIESVDGRKGIDSLVRVCQEKLSEDPITGCVFIFRSRRGTSIRLLSYDGQGYWLAQKRLSKGRFTWWPESTSAAKQLEAYEAQLLLVAGDVSRVRAAPMWRRVSELK